MKNSILASVLVCFSISISFSLDANLSLAVFKSSETPYIEVYLQVVGGTVAFVPANDTVRQAQVEVIVLFKQNGNIVKFDKYVLNSPLATTSNDFFDTKRYGLAPGTYDLDVSVKDLNRPDNARQYSQTFDLLFPEGRVGQSGIQLLASLRKSGVGQADNNLVKVGHIFEPLPSHFLDKYCDRLIFYNEIYDTDQLVGEDFMVSYFIEEEEPSQGAKPIGLTHKRRPPDLVVPVLHQMDIQGLKSGNYKLVVEVKNKSGELLSRKSVKFQRSNPYLGASREDIASSTNSLDQEFVSRLTEQELRYGLKAIAMQVDKVDGELLNMLIAEKKTAAMQLYLFSFWAKQSPQNPEKGYKEYMVVAKAIDDKFNNGFGYGFETDRGYVYMKYGVPSDIVPVENEPSAPPYEIWFYNQFPQTGQNNVKFLFYNPSLATNGHRLLHSNARGEVNNPNWEVELYRNAPNEIEGSNYIDATHMQGNMGRHARRLFESF